MIPNGLNILEFVVIFYVVLSIVHFGSQLILATLNHFAQRKQRVSNEHIIQEALQNNVFPSISVVYPIYNETPEVLAQVMYTASACLHIPNLELIFVDDGSKNRDQLQPIYDKFAQANGVTVLYQENKGKREAQYTGFAIAKGEYVITVDSDTLINEAGIYTIVAPMLQDSRIGAITGDVRVENENQNILTYIISLRYWLAFNLERAAQSYTGSMLCCSGPFSIYRKSLIDEVKDDYINQYFAGQKCTYGDDRHLTNLIIAKGYKTLYQEGAIAHTFVPTTLGEYVTQQTRWNKSFFRELLWTLPQWLKISVYSLWDVIAQIVLFVSFVVILSINLFDFLNTFDIKILIYYVVLLIATASIRSLYGLIRTFNIGFILFPLYGFMHIAVLMPIRFKSLLTMTNNGWGTRGSKKTNPIGNFVLWLAGFAVLVSILTYFINLALPDHIMENFKAFRFYNTASISEFTNQIIILWSYTLIPLLVVCVFFTIVSVVQNYMQNRKRYLIKTTV